MSSPTNRHLEAIWTRFFVQEVYHTQDPRNKVIQLFCRTLSSLEIETEIISCYNENVAYIDVPKLQAQCGVSDLCTMLTEKPDSLMNCLGIALSLNASSCYCDTPVIVQPVLRDLPPSCMPMDFSVLKSSLVNQLVVLEGYVVRVSRCRPLIASASFRCNKCNAEVCMRFRDGIYALPNACKTEKCRSGSFSLVRSSIETIDFQRIRLQERSVSDMTSSGNSDSFDEEMARSYQASASSRTPRVMEIEVRGRLVGVVTGGSVIRCVGTLRSLAEDNRGIRNKGRGQMSEEGALFQLYVEANSIRALDSEKQDAVLSSSTTLSQSLSNVHHSVASLVGTGFDVKTLIASFCPEIFGHSSIKLGLLLSLVGGSRHSTERSRADIHAILVGDPGLGKSQLLRAAASLASKAVSVCGNSTSTAGITACVGKDAGSSCLEAGAMVLADGGVCCVDELDKMTSDPQSLLEAMEQQSVTIAKGGIVAALRTQTTVIAAANPASGAFDRRRTVAENLKMPPALVSRFDLVFVLLDQPDAALDNSISAHVTSTSDSSKPFSSCYHRDKDILNHATLKQYLCFAREHVQPRLSVEAARLLQKTYLSLRSSGGGTDVRGVTVCPRHLQSLIRLSEARAKLQLREEVLESDAAEAVELFRASLNDAYAADNGAIDLFRKTPGGKMSAPKEMRALQQALKTEHIRNNVNIFKRSEILAISQRLRLKTDFDRLIDMLRSECCLLLKGPNLYEFRG